jgi:hypothetical protein
MASMRNSNGVSFSYSVISTFWQYEEKGWAYSFSDMVGSLGA